MRLPLRHLPALPQHGSAGARVAGYSDHIVVYIPCHTIPSLIILPECEALAASERRWQDGLVPTLIILPECEALAAIERRWQDGLVPTLIILPECEALAAL